MSGYGGGMSLSISYDKINKKLSPVISVAMPVFNGDKYLAEAIDSILAQTFTDFEFIIIDDGSKDGSLNILREYEKRDSRIRLIARENRNLSDTLNEIILLARGQWVARMDQDDIALPQRFERQLQWLEQTGADICGGWIQLFGAADKRILKHPQTDSAVKMELLFGSSFAHPTVIMKAELVKKLRYDKAWEHCEDYDLWERAVHAGWKMTNVPEVLLMYRQHEEQTSKVTSTKKLQLTQKIRRRYWQFIIESMNLNEEWIDEVIKLREPSPVKVNMNDVDSAFLALLQCNHGESRAIIFDHATRLYFRAAANCPDAATRWCELNHRFGYSNGRTTICQLWLMSTFKLGPNARLFQFFKKLYFILTK